jgi:hypothetical protein
MSGAKTSGGVSITGSVGTVRGDIVGRDKIINTVDQTSQGDLDNAFRPLIEAIKAAPPDKRTEADAKLTALQEEAAKGEEADDGAIAKLIDGLVGLVPGAVTAVTSAFATPVLGGIAGPVTKFVLDKLLGK